MQRKMLYCGMGLAVNKKTAFFFSKQAFIKKYIMWGEVILINSLLGSSRLLKCVADS